VSAWRDSEVARKFLEERRGAIPYAADQLDLMLQLVRHFRPEPRTVVDLGCGDGLLARTLLAAFPGARAVLLDHSEPMLERARGAMAEFASRCEIRRADLAEPLAPHLGTDGVDVIVSGFAIHHLPHPRKQDLYEEVYTLLAPGGLFVNVEHVASPGRPLEALFETLYVDHIAARTGRSRPQVEAEYHGRPDKADNILLAVETQVEWLREIGFEEADCYFKWLELAVFGGVRPH
jgi:tRNA (cmo5U34)-methyltransferase